MVVINLRDADKSKDNRNALITQSKIDALMNERRRAEAEILKLQNNIKILTHSIAENGNAAALKDTDNNTPKIKQIDLEIVELRRQYEATLREKEVERNKLEAENRQLQLQSKKKKTSLSIDEIKLKKMTDQLVAKEAEQKKREIEIKTLKLRLKPF